MKTLSITAFMLVPLFADAIITWEGFAGFMMLLIAIYCVYKYAVKKADQWEREKERKEFDESEIYK